MWRMLASLRRTLHDDSVPHHQAAPSKRFSERLARAMSQLRDQDLEIRLGRIYVLERMARMSDDSYWPVIEALTAYVRENAPWRDGARAGETLRPRPDIQAVLTVLARRPHYYGNGEDRLLDLAGADLRGMHLVGAHLERAFLVATHLEGAELTRAVMERVEAVDAHLEGACLIGARLQKATLARAHLQRADLSWAYLEEAELQGAHLEGADLRGAIGLRPEQLGEAFLDERTRVPDQLRGPALAAARLQSGRRD